jgi:ketosteroid isomerase-like protein
MTNTDRNLELTRAFLRSFEKRDEENLSFYAPDAIQQEFPNRLVNQTVTRDVAAMRAARIRGNKSVRSEHYEILTLVANGEDVACEVIWSGVLGIGLGSLQPGDTLRAYLAMFITWRGGRIVRQRNYDCFEPFAPPSEVMVGI